MTVPTGTASMLDIQNEFGGSNPISLSEYYGAASGVPTSGTISINDFRGKTAAAEVVAMYKGILRFVDNPIVFNVSTQPGDVLVLFELTPTLYNTETPSGWNVFQPEFYANDTEDTSMEGAWKVANGTSETVTCASIGTQSFYRSAYLFVIRGCGSSPFKSKANYTVTNTATHTSKTVSKGAGDVVLFAAINAHNDGTRAYTVSGGTSGWVTATQTGASSIDSSDAGGYLSGNTSTSITTPLLSRVGAGSEDSAVLTWATFGP